MKDRKKVKVVEGNLKLTQGFEQRHKLTCLAERASDLTHQFCVL